MSDRGQHPHAPNATSASGAAQAGYQALPHSDEAERSVIGGVLLYEQALVHILDLVAPEDFYHPTLAAIYQAMLDLVGASKPVDAITVADQMKASDSFGRLKAFGGEALFAELMSTVITVDNIGFHARVVAMKAKVRRLIEAAQAIAARGRGEYGTAEDFLGDAEREVLAITTARAPSRNIAIAEVLIPAVHEIADRGERAIEITGVRTKLRALDEYLSGFQPGKLYILAARPSIGKTALALQCAEAAAEDGEPAFVSSLEMDEFELVERALSGRARIEGAALRRGRLTAQGWMALHRAASGLSSLPITLNTAATTLPQLEAAVNRWRAETLRQWEGRCRAARDAQKAEPPRPRGLVVVDYIQLMDTQQQRGETEAQAIGRMSTGLKRLAKKLQVPVLALAQLNREAEKEKRPPRRSDLRGSGQIEQDADVIMFLHAEEEHVAIRPTDLIIAKQRSGPTGKCQLTFERAITRFFDIDDGAPAQQNLPGGGGGWHPNAPGEP